MPKAYCEGVNGERLIVVVIRGICKAQLVLSTRAHSATLILLCCLSMNPFDWEWYGGTKRWSIPSCSKALDRTEFANSLPLSVTITCGTSKGPHHD